MYTYETDAGGQDGQDGGQGEPATAGTLWDGSCALRMNTYPYIPKSCAPYTGARGGERGGEGDGPLERDRAVNARTRQVDQGGFGQGGREEEREVNRMGACEQRGEELDSMPTFLVCG